jgi:hypothetical protein
LKKKIYKSEENEKNYPATSVSVSVVVELVTGTAHIAATEARPDAKTATAAVYVCSTVTRYFSSSNRLVNMARKAARWV